ncbi:hypothetical protein RFI_33742, partial [Reticulomyxa filosa]
EEKKELQLEIDNLKQIKDEIKYEEISVISAGKTTSSFSQTQSSHPTLHEVNKQKESIQSKDKQSLNKENKIKKDTRCYQRVDKQNEMVDNISDVEDQELSSSLPTLPLPRHSIPTFGRNSEGIKKFKEHTEKVHIYCVKFSPYHYHLNNRSIVCFSSEKKIHFWNFKRMQVVKSLHGHPKTVTSIQFSPFSDGRYLCSASDDSTIKLWDIKTFESLHSFKGHKDWIYCVDFSPSPSNSDKNKTNVVGGNGYKICSASGDKTIRIWDVETAKESLVFEGHKDVVNTVKYLPCEAGVSNNANMIISGSSDQLVRLWDTRSKKSCGACIGHSDTVSCVEYLLLKSRKSSSCLIGSTKAICSGSYDNTIRFWDIRKLETFHKINGKDTDGGITCFKFFPLEDAENGFNGNYALCYGSKKGPIRMHG